jgi:hypothetical protein
MRHERRDSVADYRHVERKLEVSDSAEVVCQSRDLGPRLIVREEGNRVCDVGRQRPGPSGRVRPSPQACEGRAVEISQRHDGLTHLGQPLASWDHRKSHFAEFALNPWPAGADAELDGRSGDAYTQVPTRRSVSAAADASMGARRRLPLRDVRLNSVE